MQNEKMGICVGGDLVMLEVSAPYPDSYQETLKRAERELNSAARPQLQTVDSDMEQYRVIYLGYPIWHGTAPMPVFTFLEAYDLTGKTVVPFCTSGGSGIRESVSDIRDSCPGAVVLEGLRVSDPDSIEPWLNGLNLPRVDAVKNDQMRIHVQTDGKTVVFELNDSAAAKGLYEQLPLTVEVENFSDNEKIFYPPKQLDITDAPQADAGAGTLAYYTPWGDVVMFYGDYSVNGQLFELGRAVSGGGEIGSLTGTLRIEKGE